MGQTILDTIDWHYKKGKLAIGVTRDGRNVELDEHGHLFQLFTPREQREHGLPSRVPLSPEEVAA